MTSLTAGGPGSPVSGIVTDDAQGPAMGRMDMTLDPMLDATASAPSHVAQFPSLKGTASGRVPHHAFVMVGTQESRPPAVLPTANDNIRAGTTRTPSVWRDLIFLAILAMTIVGAFWSGKLNATQRVIVVPGPSSDRHMVT